MSNAVTLLERLGGAERISAIVEDVLDRLAVNPVLATRMRRLDLPRLQDRLSRLLCAACDGSGPSDGDLHAAHAGLDLSERELIAAVDVIVAAMTAAGADAAEINEVIAILGSLKARVVRL